MIILEPQAAGLMGELSSKGVPCRGHGLFEHLTGIILTLCVTYACRYQPNKALDPASGEGLRSPTADQKQQVRESRGSVSE
jgi:hypothetical protein